MPIYWIKRLMLIALIFAVSATVSACGRRGALEAPPSSQVIVADDTGEITEKPEEADEPFILDPLI